MEFEGERRGRPRAAPSDDDKVTKIREANRQNYERRKDAEKAGGVGRKSISIASDFFHPAYLLVLILKVKLMFSSSQVMMHQ